ncbi:hypothetical protein GOZ90_13240 [Agrobacterium vitis]|uniref:Uncharacterized protein n=1 Tax=Agrobacterium vitis TaxID=373 RepID=A0A6A9UEA9_AGRVI|nr:hypothetical protein [Agrobacterium vitis]MCE6074969.1 hypothetical protein [Agrobacterium vitis]MCM2467626.1 hypothetical protein [Agrobacterium vitis]MUO68469.1 hypothetical protein [Agrobacterium vitis]MUO83313.1 hypothetical protein [Agrobacterium vitis]MUZ73647.1 hypothetical protein [Agrobacterium vitis]
MAKKKSITLSVHRAIIDDNFPYTLAQLLEKMKTEEDKFQPVVKRGLFDRAALKFPSFPKTNQAIAAVFALYEEGAEKSTIRISASNEEYSTKNLSAPQEFEFLDHEVAILVDGNYVIACGLGKRQALLIDTIAKFAKPYGIEIHHSTLDLTSIPNRLTVEKIRSIGVESIRFDAANFLGSLDISTHSLIGTIFSSSATVADFQKHEMVAELNIKPKPLRRAKIETTKTQKNEWLERAAIRTFQDGEVSSYTIILDDKTEWKEGDLKLTRSVPIDKDGSSFKISDALQAMLNYLEELRLKGHLN